MKVNDISIVIGLGMGDEAKGAQVNYLASQSKNPIVIRFGGGHQVGHTVVKNGIRHVFSNFGSGTLSGAPTYWSENCTVNPLGVLKEGNELRSLGIEPVIYYHPDAMVTTPFDIVKNRKLDATNFHGTVGVGFGTTIQRNEDHYHLSIRDLQYPSIRDAKLKLIMKYYGYIHINDVDGYGIETNKVLAEFRAACDDLVNRYQIFDDFQRFFNQDLIFEGHQGIMLDMDYGFFPHVTRSNTTAKLAVEMIEKYDLHNSRYFINTYYITRAYQTRHGNGPMTNEDLLDEKGVLLTHSFIKDNPLETNTNDGYQGTFRKSVLDLDLLKYAISCDKKHNRSSVKNLVISCLDQVPEAIPVSINGKLTTMSYEAIGQYLRISKIYPTYSDEGYKNI